MVVNFITIYKSLGHTAFGNHLMCLWLILIFYITRHILLAGKDQQIPWSLVVLLMILCSVSSWVTHHLEFLCVALMGVIYLPFVVLTFLSLTMYQELLLDNRIITLNLLYGPRGMLLLLSSFYRRKWRCGAVKDFSQSSSWVSVRAMIDPWTWPKALRWLMQWDLPVPLKWIWFGITLDNFDLFFPVPFSPAWVTGMSSTPFKRGTIQKLKWFLPHWLFVGKSIHL